MRDDLIGAAEFTVRVAATASHIAAAAERFTLQLDTGGVLQIAALCTD